MVTWIPSIYPLYVSIYTSTMDPMGSSTETVVMAAASPLCNCWTIKRMPTVPLVNGMGGSGATRKTLWQLMQVSSWRHISCHTDKNRYYTWSYIDISIFDVNGHFMVMNMGWLMVQFMVICPIYKLWSVVIYHRDWWDIPMASLWNSSNLKDLPASHVWLPGCH